MRTASSPTVASVCEYIDNTADGTLVLLPCGYPITLTDDNDWAGEPFYCPYTGIEVFYPYGADW